MKRSIKLSVAALVAAAPLVTGCATGQPFAWTGGPAEAVSKNQKPSTSMELARGRNLELSGDWDKAEEVYQDLVAEEPDKWETHHRLAVVADKQKRYKLAQEEYTKAIQLNPENAQLFNDLGYCFYLQGKLPEAESALAKAVRLESRNARFRNNLGMVIGHQGRIEEAFDQFSKAGSEADAFYNVAFIYAANENNAAAIECFQLALETDPMHEKAQSALDSFARDEADLPPAANLVRYNENGGDAISQADFATGMPNNREAGEATRQLHQRSRGLMERRMASQRNAAQNRQSQGTQATTQQQAPTQQ